MSINEKLDAFASTLDQLRREVAAVLPETKKAQDAAKEAQRCVRDLRSDGRFQAIGADIKAINEFERQLVERIEFLEGDKQHEDHIQRIGRLAADMSRWQARLETVEEDIRDLGRGASGPVTGEVPRLLIEDMIDLCEHWKDTNEGEGWNARREERMLRRLRRLLGDG